MFHAPEPMSLRARCLHDAGMMALLALVLVPLYLLLNEYWQSLFRLALLYGVLGLFCSRLGGYVRRVMQRLPAEMAPWQGGPGAAAATPWLETHFGAAEAIRRVRQDPHYVQEVLKPRLQRLLVYRLSGALDVPPEALDDARLAQLDPALWDFLQRCEATGLWARFRYRRQRVDDVRDALQRLEAL